MTRFLPVSVWLYAFVIAAILSLPYLAGAARTPADWQYSGTAVVPGGFMVDYNSHLAKMWQGARGEWDYHLLFTHEPHPGLPGIQSFYVALGALAQVSGLSFPAVYHLARFLLTLALILALWRFACRFFERGSDRWTAVLFGTVVMGWGWLLYFAAPLLPETPAPIEFWLMDAYNLTGAFYMPHFSAAILLQMLAVLVLLDFLEHTGTRTPQLTRISLLTLILAVDVLIQPYVVLLTFPLFGFMVLADLWKRHGGRITMRRYEVIVPYLGLIIPALVHGGLAVLQLVLLRSDPVWENFTAQNITASPAPIYYLFGYLPFLLPIAYLTFQHFSTSASQPAAQGNENSALSTRYSTLFVPVMWVLIVVVLLYAPLPTQRRYLLGVQTPLAMLAAAGWTRLMKRLQRRVRPLVAIPYFVLAGVALLLVLTGNFIGLTPDATPAAFYSPDELAGYAWLRDQALPDDLVLTTLDGEGKGSGGRLVAMTGLHVYVGHWIETADFQRKVREIEQFYQPETDDAWRLERLQAAGIDLVWYDAYARAFGTWSPDQAAYLEPVFSSTTVTIYRVHTDEA